MSSLAHHGVKGQKWGVRRYQNPDGTRTDRGKKQAKLRRLQRNTSEDFISIRKTLSDDDLRMLNYSDKAIKYMRKNGSLNNDPITSITAHRVIQKDKNGTPVTYVEANGFTSDDLETGKRMVRILSIDLASRGDGDYRGKGYAVAAGKQMVRWFDRYGYKEYNHMEWFAKADNVASQKTAEKIGFKKMDYVYDWMKNDGSSGWVGYSYRHKSPKQKQFDDATKQVLSKTSTNVRSITKEPADIHGVIDRARCSEKDARTCIKLADRIYEKAASVEPQITQDIIGIVNNSNSSMYGLEHRLKQPTSMAGKIGSDSKSDGVSFVEAANGIKDAVRYTTVSDNKSFVSDYRQLKSGLESKGYEEVKCKNFFEKYRAGEVQHKAVQTTFKSPTGYEFELQFQTPESQAAKDLKIPIYEERRKQGISSSRAKELEKQMHDLAERVPYPDGIETIESHNKVKHSSIGGNMNYIYGNTLILGDTSYLEHHGIKNQKWGVRRFQNPDGSLTAAGRIRYGVTGAAKAAFKVGKKLGSATASAARAGVKKAKDNAYTKKKEKVSQTREGVLKNKKMFTADELKALENRFKIEDEMSEASLRHGQAVAKTVSQYANTTRDVLSALQTGGNAVSAITKAFADIQSYQNAKGVAEAAKEKGMTTKEFDLFLKEKYPNAKKDDGSKKKDKNSNKAQHSDPEDDGDDDNPPNNGGGGGSKKQAEYDTKRRAAQEDIYNKKSSELKQREDYLNKRQDALVKVSKQRQSEQEARDEDLNRRDKAASEREEKLKSIAKDAADVMNKLKERQDNLDRREADLNNIANALDSEIGYRIDTISDLRKTLHDDDDSSKKKKSAKHSAIGEEMYVDYLEHFGTKGMKWGVRRYQNPDGTLTDAGRKHYQKKLDLEERKLTAANAARGQYERVRPAATAGSAIVGAIVGASLGAASMLTPAGIAAGAAYMAAVSGASMYTRMTIKGAVAGAGAKRSKKKISKYKEALSQYGFQIQNGVLMYGFTPSDELEHFGIKNMKWGVRRFQNKDGSLTEAGKQRYANTGNLDSGGGGGGGAPEEEDEETKKAIEEAAKKAGMTVDEYRKKFADKVAALKEKARDAAWDARYAVEDAADAVTGKTSKEIAEKSAKSAEENERKAKAARKEGRDEDAAKYEEWAKQSREISEYRQGKYEKSLAGRYDRAKASIVKRIPGRYDSLKVDSKKKSASHAAFIEDGTLYLAHHGILGQKWGVRRFQNPDGTLTVAGKKREAKLAKKKAKVTAKAAKYRNKDISRYDLEIAKAKDPDQKYRYEQLRKHTEKLSDKEIIAQQKHSRAVAAGEGIVATVAVSLGLGMPNIGSIAIGAAVAESIAKTTRDNYRVRSINAERMQESVHKEYENLINHSAFIEDGTLYLAHHGILGQKWGVRRFQDAAGRLTAAGKKRIKDAKSKLGNAGAKYKATSVENTESVVAPGGGAADDWDDFDEETLDIYIQNMLSLSDEDLALLGLKRSDLENAKSKDDKYKIVLALKKYDNPTAKGKRVLNSLMNAMFSSNLLATLSPVTLTGGALFAKMREAAAERRKAREPVDPKTGLHLKQEWDKAPEFDVVNVNPGFTNLSDNTKNNCMLCTTAYDLRRRGYDVNAERISQGLDYNDVKRYYPDAEVRNITNASTTKELNKKTRAALISQGEGARGNLMVQWQGGAGGHSMAYEVHDGDVKIYDAQTGAVKSTEDVIQYTVSVSYARLDNVEPDWDRIKEAVR